MFAAMIQVGWVYSRIRTWSLAANKVKCGTLPIPAKEKDLRAWIDFDNNPLAHHHAWIKDRVAWTFNGSRLLEAAMPYFSNSCCYLFVLSYFEAPVVVDSPVVHQEIAVCCLWCPWTLERTLLPSAGVGARMR